jgi:hypothetical protein
MKTIKISSLLKLQGAAFADGHWPNKKGGAPYSYHGRGSPTYTFRIDPDPLRRESRYRWTVCEGIQIHVRSPHSYATKDEAEKEAAKAVVRREEHWRIGL